MLNLLKIMAWHRETTNHHLNQWWPVYWLIYARQSLNGLGDRQKWRCISAPIYIYIYLHIHVRRVICDEYRQWRWYTSIINMMTSWHGHNFRVLLDLCEGNHRELVYSHNRWSVMRKVNVFLQLLNRCIRSVDFKLASIIQTRITYWISYSYLQMSSQFSCGDSWQNIHWI